MSSISLWFSQALLPDGWSDGVRLTLAGGRIARVERGVGPADGDARHGIAVPGLPNLHSHAFQRGMAGLAEPRRADGDSFWTWREAMYRFLDRVDPDLVEAIAAFAYAEMLESGFTRVGEFHYLHHDRDGRPFAAPGEMMTRLASAAAETGIALTLLPSFYAHGGCGGAPPVPGQRRFITGVDGFGRLVEAARMAVRDLPDAATGIAPHSLRAVTGEELREVVALAPDGPVHIHAAEQTREVDECVAWSGQRPVEWLLDHANVGARWCLIHATHMTADETARLAATGAVAGLCPITEGHLGDGVFPGVAFADAGGRWGVGTDSNILIDAAGELRALEYNQRLQHRARNLMAAVDGRSVGRSLFDAALHGGTQVLGCQAPSGDEKRCLAPFRAAGLAESAAADIVSLADSAASLAGATGDAALDAWIFAARGGAVDAVWRAGRQVVAGGRHVRRDALLARYRRAIEAVRG